MGAPARAWLSAIALAAFVVGLDQLSKAAVEQSIAIGGTVDVLGPLQLTHVGNTGIAFGLAEGGGVLIIIATFVALSVITAIFARDPTRPGVWPAIGLLMGGAVGNLVDRLGQSAVTDFVKVSVWPSFNLADVAITVGVLLLAWIYLRSPDRAGRDEPAVTSGPGAGEGDRENA